MKINHMNIFHMKISQIMVHMYSTYVHTNIIQRIAIAIIMNLHIQQIHFYALFCNLLVSITEIETFVLQTLCPSIFINNVFPQIKSPLE